MKTVSLILMPLLLVAAPRANAQDPPQNPLPRLAAAAARAAADLTASADVPSQAVQPRPVQAPPPPPAPPVRSGSMIGYIDDATVGTKVRIRFDTGMHVNAPDRAEFFYAKCGCYRDPSVGPAAFDPDAPGPAPDIATDLNFQQFYIQAEYALSPRVSILGELPVRWLQPQEFAGGAPGFSSSSGLGDLKTGAKFALSSTNTQVATVQVQLFLPSGDSEKGLGTNHASLEPAFLIYQRASERVVIEGELSVRFPLGGSAPVPTAADGKFAGNVLFYGIGPSVEVYRSRGFSVSPVIELTGWSVLSGFATIPNVDPDASGTNIVNLKFGGRIGWKDYSSFYIGYGHALTDAKWYSDIGTVRVPVTPSDGGLSTDESDARRSLRRRPRLDRRNLDRRRALAEVAQRPTSTGFAR